MTVLVDSDVLIEVTRGRDHGIVAKWEDLARSEDVLLCSPVSVAEVWQGARANEHAVLTDLFRTLTCAAADARTGFLAGEYLRQYRKSHSVELGDALIAATAVENSAVLWTRNHKHYPMKGLSFY
jgi:predicted nucleic acid-binding protein